MKRRLFAVLIGAALMLSACEVEPEDAEETAAQSMEAVTTPAGVTNAADQNAGSTKSDKEPGGATKESAVLDSSENVKTTEEVKTTEVPKTTGEPETTEVVTTTEAPKTTEPETTPEAVKPVETGEVRPVTVTMSKNVKLDLTGHMGQVVRALVENNGYVQHISANEFVTADEDGNVYFLDADASEILGKKKPVIGILPGKYNTQLGVDCRGYIQYSFNSEYYSGIKELSLLEGWNGDFSKLDNYLTDENSIHSGQYRFAVFKGGKVVSLSELRERYGAEAAELGDFRKLRQYLMHIYGQASQKINRLTSGIVGDTRKIIEPWTSGRSELTDDDQTNICCMFLAMIDWGSSAGDVAYGSMMWLCDAELQWLDIAVPCSDYEYSLLRPLRKEEEKGDLAKFESMTVGWKFVGYDIPEDADPEDTAEVESLMQAFAEAGTYMGMTTQKGVATAVFGTPSLAYYDDEKFYFSERSNDYGTYKIDGDIMTIVDPDDEYHLIFQRMTESEREKFTALTEEEIQTILKRADERMHEWSLSEERETRKSDSSNSGRDSNKEDPAR